MKCRNCSQPIRPERGDSPGIKMCITCKANDMESALVAQARFEENVTRGFLDHEIFGPYFRVSDLVAS